MATITQHAVGTFCWPELATIDRPRAQSFYTQLFGWEVREQDMGEAGTYTLLRKDDRDVGALYQLSKDQREQGVPPHWLSYVAVDNADRAAEQAVRLGAKPIMAPLDVYDIGRMAVLEDPLTLLEAALANEGVDEQLAGRAVAAFRETGSLSSV